MADPERAVNREDHLVLLELHCHSVVVTLGRDLQRRAAVASGERCGDRETETSAGHEVGHDYASPIILKVRLMRSPTFSVVFGTSCFQKFCIVPAMMMTVPFPTWKLVASFVRLCRIRNVRVAPN